MTIVCSVYGIVDELKTNQLLKREQSTQLTNAKRVDTSRCIFHVEIMCGIEGPSF